MPAPKGNLNAARNGNKLANNKAGIRRLTVGEFPASLNHVKIEGRRYRRALEDAVVDAHGEVTVTAAHSIDTAAGAVVHGGICRWLLRNKIDTMTTADILSCSRELLKSKEARNRSVKALELDRDDQDELNTLYTTLESPQTPAKGLQGKERENTTQPRPGP